MGFLLRNAQCELSSISRRVVLCGISSTVCKSRVLSERGSMISLSACNKCILAIRTELGLRLEHLKPMWGSNLSHKWAMTMSTRAESSKHLTIDDVKHLCTSSRGATHLITANIKKTCLLTVYFYIGLCCELNLGLFIWYYMILCGMRMNGRRPRLLHRIYAHSVSI